MNMKQRKAIAIVVIWGVLIMLSLLALAALRLMGNQGTITESSVRRTKAYYTAKAAIVQTFETCRKGSCPSTAVSLSLNNMTATANTADVDESFCHNCTKITANVIY